MLVHKLCTKISFHFFSLKQKRQIFVPHLHIFALLTLTSLSSPLQSVVSYIELTKSNVKFTANRLWCITSGSPVYGSTVDCLECLRLVTGARWYLSNRHIHEDLSVPLFADHIRALTASFDSKLADVRNSLVWQLGRYLSWPRVDPVPRRENQERRGPVGQSSPSLDDGQPCRLSESLSALISRALFGCPDWGFSMIFPQL
jgi:hypothetical protein